MTFSVHAAGLALSVAPLGRSGWRGTVSWFLSAVPNESPFLVAYVVVASTLLAGAAWTSVVWIAVGLMATVILLTAPVVVRRSLKAQGVIAEALAVGFGAAWVGSRAARA